MNLPRKPRIAVISAGRMGSGIAALLLHHGAQVVTCLDGRSAASRARAAAIGLPSVARQELAAVDILLSIVPPDAALPLAEEFAAAGIFSSGGPLFVDCNAVSPDTLGRIEGCVRAAGGRCVDGAIVGGPPQPDGSLPPLLYVSGEFATNLVPLRDLGLMLHVLDAPVGAASALKMCFAAVSKGLTALVTQVILQSTAANVAGPLQAQLSRSFGQALDWAGRQAPQLPDKSGRWVGEMQEIAHFLRDIPGAEQIFSGAADYYGWLAGQKAEPTGPHAVLAGFFRATLPETMR